MSLKQYLIFMTAATFVSWLAWLIVLFYLNPEEAGFIGFALFYLALMFALVGTFSLIGFFMRVWFSREQVIFRHLRVSTRQALLFSILIISLLMMQGSGYLRWWSILLVVALLALIEFFFISRKVVSRA